MTFTKKQKAIGAVALVILGLVLLVAGFDIVGGIFTALGALFTKQTVSSHRMAPSVTVGPAEGKHIDLKEAAELRQSLRDKVESFREKMR